MKRQLILILSLVVLILLTGGIYLGVDRYQTQKNKKAEEEAAALKLLQYDASAIQKVTLQTPDGTFCTVLNEDSDWELSEEESDETNFEINTYYVSYLVNAFSNLTATRDMGEATSETKSQFGLEDPTVITLSDDTAEYTIYAGKQTATSEAYYIMIDGKPDIYLADSETYGSYLSINKNSLKYIYLLYNKDSNLSSIRLERNKEVVFDISSPDNGVTWEMNEPAKGNTVNAANVSTVKTAIQQALITGFGDENVTPDQYAKYGFDDPYYVLTYTQLNGETTTYYALEYNSDQDTYVTLLDVTRKEILYVEPSYLSFLNVETEDMLDHTLCNVGIDQVSAVDFQADDVSVHMDIDYANSTYVVDGTTIDSSNTSASDAFMDLYDSLRELSFNFLDLDAQIPDDAESTVSIVYTLLDGTKRTVELIPIDDTTYWAMIDGSYSGYITRRYQISDRGGILPLYETLKELLDKGDA